MSPYDLVAFRAAVKLNITTAICAAVAEDHRLDFELARMLADNVNIEIL